MATISYHDFDQLLREAKQIVTDYAMKPHVCLVHDDEHGELWILTEEHIHYYNYQRSNIEGRRIPVGRTWDACLDALKEYQLFRFIKGSIR